MLMILSPILPAAPLAGKSMMSPAFFVLSFALVCSVFGLTSEQTADHDNKPRSKISIPDYDLNINNHWTSKINRNYINYDENIDELKPNTNKGDITQARNLNFDISNIQKRVARVRKYDPIGLELKSSTLDTRLESKMVIPGFDLKKNNQWTNKSNREYNNYSDKLDEVKTDADKGDDIQARNLNIHKSNVRLKNTKIRKYDPSSLNTKSTSKVKPDPDKGDDVQSRNLDYHRNFMRTRDNRIRKFDPRSLVAKSRVKRDLDMEAKCESFQFDYTEMTITHPHAKNSGNNNYYNNTDCIIKINATTFDQVIQLTFVDIFSIEYHPQCANDYLEIRDGYYGYADLMGRFCGSEFPRILQTKGPNVWLKFHSDKSIEKEGFKIIVEFKVAPSRHIPESCYLTFKGEKWGMISKKLIDKSCTENSPQALDILWTIIVPVDMRIHLNFTHYNLAKPNDCHSNIIQVFETREQEMDFQLAEYCGSVANHVTTLSETNGHIMYVRLYATKEARENTTFNATFNSYRRLASIDEDCHSDEFDCEDSTCIDLRLACDNIVHCRLKNDEDSALCTVMAVSALHKPSILASFVVFMLILSGTMLVIIFKMLWKIYKDQKKIKEQVRQSCEDRLESLAGSRMILDPKRLQRESEPRASLERENHNNEMVKKQRSLPTKHKQSSIESDYPENQLDLDEEIWRREIDAMLKDEDISIEQNERKRKKSDFSKKEESMRSRTKENGDAKEKKEKEQKKELKDVSVGVADTTESGCQTRDSLFQTDPPPSSEGSATNSRGFSTFGFSGNTIIRTSPPAPKNSSEIKIELIKPKPQHQESKAQKKIDRRPISNETTRSAPDVIIVSKPTP
ncbi:hypothetical protein PYW08_009050 [Mythimna loreyi]|uniref:Uncharacterized protein n=1 Tax=Mythimna loreyi TaxID=667449 RepID=A0ACC2Q8P4_9NEOP|nr:hypothetical protein PYW08_009050 [Mythimna loreyi]